MQKNARDEQAKRQQKKLLEERKKKAAEKKQGKSEPPKAAKEDPSKVPPKPKVWKKEEKGDAFEGHVEPDKEENEDDEEENEFLSAHEWKPFPLHTLPRTLREYAQQHAKAINCDEAMIALHMFAVFGGLIGNSRVVMGKATWAEPSVFWTTIIADSGGGKSPAWRAALSPLQSINSTFKKTYQAKEKEYHKDLRAYLKTPLKKGDYERSKDDQEAPKEPEQQQILIDDITVESVVDVAKVNPRGLILSKDEMKAWFGSFARYRSGGSGTSDDAFWLSCFNAGGVIVNRKTAKQKVTMVDRVAVSMCGSIPHATMRACAPDASFDSGLIPRFLFAMPPKRLKVWTEDSVEEGVQKNYELLAYDMDEKARLMVEANKGVPIQVLLDKAGTNAFKQFYNEWAHIQWGSSGTISYALSKLEAYSLRIAMLFAVIEAEERKDNNETVTEQHIARSAECVRWFANETQRVYKLLHGDQAQNSQTELVNWIKLRGGSVTPRRLFKSNKAKWLSIKHAYAVLNGLVVNKIGVWEQVRPKDNVGRPSVVFRLLSISERPDKAG